MSDDDNLQADIAGWRKQIGIAEDLVQRLAMHADAEVQYSAKAPVRTAVPPKAKRRRKAKHKPRMVVNARQHGASGTKKPKGTNGPVRHVGATEVAAPVKAVRGAALYAAQLAQLDEIKAAIDAAGNDPEAVQPLYARANAVIIECDGRVKFKPWCTKAFRMRARRAFARPEKAPRIPEGAQANIADSARQADRLRRA